MRKNVLPPHHINSVIYKYTCSYGSDYIGRTSNRLDLRIKQHLPVRILNLELKRGQLENTSRSSIAEHMINSRECVAEFNVDRFSILSRSHSIFHPKLLETLYVRSLQPSLCKQRDCLLELNVISLWPSVHLYYYLPLIVFFGYIFLNIFLYFSSSFLHSSTFFPLHSPFKIFFSCVSSLIRARRNLSFTFLLTINMPTVSLNLYVFLAINKFLIINYLVKHLVYIYIYIYISSIYDDGRIHGLFLTLSLSLSL